MIYLLADDRAKRERVEESIKVVFRRTSRTLSVTILVLGFGFAPNAVAEEWSFRIAPYAWMAGIEGVVKPFDAGPTTDVDLSFSDVLENLDIGPCQAV